MTEEPSKHEIAVTAWSQRAARGTLVEIIQAFELAFAALWERSRVTLGEVTLTAIVDRVLHTASERYPVLAAIELTESGLRCESLVSAAAGLSEAELSVAVRFVLVEFLTVLGNLTAEILTVALHEELSTCPSNTNAKDSETFEDKAS